jgi:hypothetical protein
MANVNIGEIAASTMEFYHKSFVDNIFKKRVLLDHLKQNGGVKMYPGGRLIRVPLMYRTSSTVQRVNGAEALDLTYQDTLDAAEYAYELYNVSITFTLEDELKNSGEPQVMSLLEAKIKQAEMSLSESVNTDLYTGTATDGDIIGLDTIISTSTTIGAISGSTYSWWRGNVDATAETLSVSDMRTIKNSCNLGNGGSNVSMIVTTQTLFEKYHALLTATYQMNQPVPTKETQRVGDAGFTSVEFEGVPVVMDESASTGKMYFINKDNFKLGIHRDANFARKPKSEPADQHLHVEHIVAYMQTVVDRRKSLGLLSGKTA